MDFVKVEKSAQNGIGDGSAQKKPDSKVGLKRERCQKLNSVVDLGERVMGHQRHVCDFTGLECVALVQCLGDFADGDNQVDLSSGHLDDRVSVCGGSGESVDHDIYCTTRIVNVEKTYSMCGLSFLLTMKTVGSLWVCHRFSWPPKHEHEHPKDW